MIRVAKNLSDIEVPQNNPLAVYRKKNLGEGLYLLEFKNGMSVLVNNAPTVKAQIKLISKHGLSTLPENDTLIFKQTLALFNKTFGGYDEKQASNLLREYMFKLRDDISPAHYQLELTSVAKSLEYKHLLQAFHLILGSEYMPEWSAFKEEVKSDRELKKGAILRLMKMF